MFVEIHPRSIKPGVLGSSPPSWLFSFQIFKNSRQSSQSGFPKLSPHSSSMEAQPVTNDQCLQFIFYWFTHVIYRRHAQKSLWDAWSTWCNNIPYLALRVHAEPTCTKHMQWTWTVVHVYQWHSSWIHPQSNSTSTDPLSFYSVYPKLCWGA